ncbi:hypothetical protein Bca4012_074949 [Brassica carinata]
MFHRFCSSLSRSSVIFPKSIKSPPFPFPRSLRRSPLTLSFSSFKMSDTNPSPIPSPTKQETLRSLESHLASPFTSSPIIPPPNQLIIVISGPSGVGKDAVITKLRESRQRLHFVVTATTRPMRHGEVDGKDYFFVTRDNFLSMVENDELLEYALVYGEYKGIPKKQIRESMSKGEDIVLRVDIQGAQTLRRILGSSAVFVFLVAESEVAMVERLVDRKTESQEELLVRVATAREEVRHLKSFDYVVVNAKGRLDDAVSRVEAIIDAEISPLLCGVLLADFRYDFITEQKVFFHSGDTTSTEYLRRRQSFKKILFVSLTPVLRLRLNFAFSRQTPKKSVSCDKKSASELSPSLSISTPLSISLDLDENPSLLTLESLHRPLWSQPLSISLVSALPLDEPLKLDLSGSPSLDNPLKFRLSQNYWLSRICVIFKECCYSHKGKLISDLMCVRCLQQVDIEYKSLKAKLQDLFNLEQQIVQVTEALCFQIVKVLEFVAKKESLQLPHGFTALQLLTVAIANVCHFSDSSHYLLCSEIYSKTLMLVMVWSQTLSSSNPDPRARPSMRQVL